jgi:hypothetical protein
VKSETNLEKKGVIVVEQLKIVVIGGVAAGP